MGQTTVIQALQNLGGTAILLEDLEKEYFKIMYPPQFYGENYAYISRDYAYKVITRFLFALQKKSTIKVERIQKTDEEFKQDQERRLSETGSPRGSRKQKVVITLL